MIAPLRTPLPSRPRQKGKEPVACSTSRLLVLAEAKRTFRNNDPLPPNLTLTFEALGGASPEIIRIYLKQSAMIRSRV
jgi:hypothetical protein